MADGLVMTTGSSRYHQSANQPTNQPGLEYEAEAVDAADKKPPGPTEGESQRSEGDAALGLAPWPTQHWC